MQQFWNFQNSEVALCTPKSLLDISWKAVPLEHLVHWSPRSNLHQTPREESSGDMCWFWDPGLRSGCMYSQTCTRNSPRKQFFEGIMFGTLPLIWGSIAWFPQVQSPPNLLANPRRVHWRYTVNLRPLGPTKPLSEPAQFMNLCDSRICFGSWFGKYLSGNQTWTRLAWFVPIPNNLASVLCTH